MDNNENKWIGVVAYFLFFIPLLVDKGSEFGKFHANQGLNLFLLSLAVSVIGAIVPVVGGIISTVGSILCLVLAIMGIINALNLEMKELPVIGSYRLLK